MKKIFTILILSLLLLNLFPFITQGQEHPTQCCKLKHDIEIDDEEQTAGTIIGSGEYCPIEGEVEIVSNWALYCTLDAIQTVADLIKIIAIVLSGIILIAAGVLFITAAGNPERISKAKTIFFWGLIGVLIIVLANFITAFARFFLGI